MIGIIQNLKDECFMKRLADDILAKIGCKNTKPRKTVIEVLESTDNPLSAEDIFLRIKELGESVNLSTVYRTLDLMENKSLVNKTVMSDGKARYELPWTGTGIIWFVLIVTSQCR